MPPCRAAVTIFSDYFSSLVEAAAGKMSCARTSCPDRYAFCGVTARVKKREKGPGSAPAVCVTHLLLDLIRSFHYFIEGVEGRGAGAQSAPVGQYPSRSHSLFSVLFGSYF